MIFELVDGRQLLYQWDLNRKLKVNDESIKEVHFCNRTGECSLVVEVVDGIANIPNTLLQSHYDFRAFGYDGEATLHEAEFKVKPRTRPSDYVYTEIEIKRYEDLEKRIDDIEKNGISEEVITEAVENYLKENQIDLEGYATEEYVNEAINNIPKVDLSDYATKTYVNEEVAKAVSGGEIDLSDYYTKEEIEAKGYLTQHQDISGKADKNHTHNEYATEEYVDNAIAEIEITGGGGSTLYRHTVTIGNVATDIKDFLDVANAVIINTSPEPFTFETLRQYLLENKLLPVSYMNVSGNTTSKMAIRLQTAESVTSASAYAGQLALYVIDTKVTSTQSVSGSYLYYPSTTPIADTVVKIGVAGGGSGEPVDLSNYYTKEEVNDLIPDTSNFITEVPSEYVTETELNAKNYLTEHQSLEDYASKDYVDEAIANIDISESDPVDLSNYYTKEETYSKTEVDEAIANAGGSGDLTNYYTKEEVEDLIPDTSSFITEVPAEYITETELNNKGYATEQYVTDAIAGIDIPESGGGGASYTFTNGLTETDGTVSWDLDNNIKLVNKGSYPIVGIGNVSDVTISNPLNCRGTVCLGEFQYATIDAQGAGNIVAGNLNSGGKAFLKSSASGNIIGGYLFGTQSSVYGQGNIIWGKSGYNSSSSSGQSLFNGEASIVVGRGLIGPYNTTIPNIAVFGSCNDSTTLTDKLLVLGNGANNGARSNAFTVDTSGNVNSAGTMTPTGADYAEYFEFEDGNPNKEDRIGLLVELVGSKIQLANGDDILGAISGTIGVIGDAEEMSWCGKYETDEFGRFIYEEVEVTDINPETGKEEVKLVTTKKISKDYDPNTPYIPRSKRPEWAPVGLMGKVLVRQDGSLSAGDYVKAINGIATKANEKTNIRVLEVMSEGIVRVLVK